LQLATDQHAAMTQELEDLAASDPSSFSQDQIWVLIRAIKVQSQVLPDVRRPSVARRLIESSVVGVRSASWAG
jgi:hypothetical protein